MATEDEQQPTGEQQSTQADQESSQGSDKLGNEAEALGQQPGRKEGEDNTVKSVLAVIVGIAVLVLVVWWATGMM